MQMAQDFERKLHENPDYLRNVWFSDESYFVVGLHKPGRCGTFLAPCTCLRSSQGKENPCTCEHRKKKDIPVAKHPDKVMIWMAINSHYRPIWFVCDNGKLNTDKYIRLMRKFKAEIETRHPGLLESGTFVYQQDGAPAHCSNKSIRWLENYFSEVISKRPKSFLGDDKFNWVSFPTIELIY